MPFSRNLQRRNVKDSSIGRYSINGDFTKVRTKFCN